MSTVMIRAVILYILIIFAVRLMGKRQLGELQPSELVVTILVSNIATLPLEDTDIPLIVGITPILILVSFEVVMSKLSMSFPCVRRLVSGSPKIVIRGGKLDPDVVKELRFSVDDLMAALRGKDVFDISEVQFAIVETTGGLSVMKKQTEDDPTRSDMGLSPEDSDPPQIVAADGNILRSAANAVGLDEKKIEAVLKSCGAELSHVFLMTADESGSCYIVLRSGGEPITVKGAGK